MRVRELAGYKRRKKAFDLALENYYQLDNLGNEQDEHPELEALMLASFDLASYIRVNGDIIRWEERQYGLHVGNAVKEAIDVMYSEAVKRPLAVEVQKLEALSRSIYEYIKRKQRVLRRTM